MIYVLPLLAAVAALAVVCGRIAAAAARSHLEDR